MKRLLASIALISSAVCVDAQQENFDTVRIQSQKLAQQVYMLKGSGGNIGVLTGPDGILMIDDQFAPLSEKISAAIKALDPGPIRFLINTHLHGDHSGGNENFKKLGATIVAHDNARERMAKERMDKFSNTMVPARDKDALPLITFPDKMNFHLNGQDIEVFHITSGHTDGDLVIHFKQADIFHTGDLYVRYGYPYIDVDSGGGINGFVTNLDKMIEVMDDKSIVIPGHGELATRKDVIVFRDKIKDIRDQVAAALKKGKKPGDLAALGITEKYEKEWGGGFLKGKDFVLMVGESILSSTGKK